MDIRDIIVLKIFYCPPTPWCFPILYEKFKAIHDVGPEALRKRLYDLERLGYIKRLKRCNPSLFEPNGKEEEVGKIIQSLIKFLESS